jgi:maleylacetate reductase
MAGMLPLARFTSEWSRARVVFGAGAVSRLGPEIDALGVTRALIITTPGRSGALGMALERLGNRLVGVCDRAAVHVPVARLREAEANVARVAPDVLVAIGGGSAVGLAKAVALGARLPIVAVPTTYAGSEMTSIWGTTDGARKRTGRDPGVAPRLVIYDPELTCALPAGISAASGMNAMAHAVEAMYAASVGPVAVGAAQDAIRSLASALPRVIAQPDDLDARTLALRGAYSAGLALELASMGLHHKICHVLGGTFGLPHAATHAAVLPHVVSFNASSAPWAMARIAEALGVQEPAEGLADLNRSLGLTRSLGELGLRETDLEHAAQFVASASYRNPRHASVDEVRALLLRAL